MEEALIFLLEKRKIQGIQVFCVWFSVNFDENKTILPRRSQKVKIYSVYLVLLRFSSKARYFPKIYSKI